MKLITKEEVLRELGNYITTSNMQTSSGASASNQFGVFYENACVFQSYSSLIAIKFNDKASEKFKSKVVICSDYKYSKTTSKYRCAFLNEKVKDTDKKIENETYLYCNELTEILEEESCQKVEIDSPLHPANQELLPELEEFNLQQIQSELNQMLEEVMDTDLFRFSKFENYRVPKSLKDLE